ncbi:MAG: hypothetical protein K2G44_01670 [Clostridia bacterium]|nr:hypothetical protein [Clostridia bacterium]
MKTEKIFSSEMNRVLEKAEELARMFKTHYIASEHIVYAMLSTNCLAGKVLKSCGLTSHAYSQYFMRTLDRNAEINGLTPKTKLLIEEAKQIASDFDGGDADTGSEHLLLAIVSSKDCLATQILESMGVDISRLETALELVLGIQ